VTDIKIIRLILIILNNSGIKYASFNSRITSDKNQTMKYLYSLIFMLSICSCNKLYFNTSIGRNLNVCKKLRGDALIYAIFVNDPNTKPWTNYDIETTIDSIKEAIKWIESKAKSNDIKLKISLAYLLKGDSIIRINKKLPKKSLIESVFTRNGPEKLTKWGDDIAGYILTDYTDTMYLPRSKERLVAKLRDERKVESVALMYFVNNYYKEDISVTINMYSFSEMEFSIVSFKNPSIITHEFLHNFGASDLYRQLYSKQKNKKLALKYFPNDIMLTTMDRNIENTEICELEKYLIGWQDTLNPKYNRLLFDGKIRIKRISVK
jgi:hypothetical protein